MKRKIWNQSSIPTTRTGVCSIRISPKSGQIIFSKELAANLDLTGKRVNFIQDEERPADWYIEVVKPSDQDAFEPRYKANGDPNYKANIIQSCWLARQILESAGCELESTSFIVASKATDGLFAIITKSAKTRQPASSK